jgi:hypothetical protein
MLPRLHFLIFVISLFLCCLSKAANVGTYPRSRLNLHQNLFSGEKGKSFAETSVGYGAGGTVLLDGRHFIPFFGFKIGTMDGRQVFLDDTTEVTASFNYNFAATEIGLEIFPIERRSKGLNIYFIGVGVVGYHFVALSKSTTLSSIPHSDQSPSLGYGAGIGTEWILNNASPNKWALNAEVIFKKESTTLFKQKFDLNSLTFLVGFGW